MSYVQTYYHIVFSTKHRAKTIPQCEERQLYMYIYTMSVQKGCKIWRIGGMEDHLHILVSLPSTMALAVYVKQIKTSTSKWLRENPLFPHFDSWEEGYAAFTYAHRDRDMIVNYIMNQKEHHKRYTYREECLRFFEEEGIEYDPKYLFVDS